MELFGRTQIFTDEQIVTADNIISVLQKAMNVHRKNRQEIKVLYDYYKGKQKILERTKEFRADILNKVVENRANEIVTFKVGYLIGEPIQYVSRTSNGDSDSLIKLNEFMFAEEKFAKDKEICDCNHICGTAYRMVLPDEKEKEDESPFEIYTLNPLNTFIVYANGLGEKPLLGVTYIVKENQEVIYSCYTDKEFFLVSDLNGKQGVKERKPHAMGSIPIIEYPANKERLGAFEIVLPLLDALNDVDSNRLDSVEAFVDALLVFKGIDITDEDFIHLKDLGGLKVPADGDVKYIAQELNQSQTQTLTDYIYDTVLTICGMPNRNKNTTKGNTGAASMLENGWSDCEARAKNSEIMYKKSEREFLKIVEKIVNKLSNINIKLSDIDIHFTRRNYENIQSKAQVFMSLINNEKVPPRFAYELSGMYSDPESAYNYHVEYNKEREAELSKQLETEDNRMIESEKAEVKTDDSENAE